MTHFFTFQNQFLKQVERERESELHNSRFLGVQIARFQFSDSIFKAETDGVFLYTSNRNGLEVWTTPSFLFLLIHFLF
jgi:hypothetical protein